MAGCLAVGVGVSVVAGPFLAVAATVAAVVVASLRLGDRTDALVVGVYCYASLGALTLVPVVPPTYPAAFGVAMVVAAALALACAEVGIRAGTVVEAKGLENTDYGQAWVVPTAVLAIGLLCWRVGAGGRAILAGVVALGVGTHGLLVHLGAPVAHQAFSLVPAALVLFVAVPVASADDYVAEGTAPSVLNAAGTTGAPTASSEGTASASEAAGASSGPSGGTPVSETAREEASAAAAAESASDAGEPPVEGWPFADQDGTASASPTADGGRSDGAVAGAAPTDEQEDPLGGLFADDGDDADGEPDPASAAGSATAAAAAAGSGSTSAAGGTASATADAADARTHRSDDADRSCQNCGADAADCEPRVVLGGADVRVALCGDCHDARTDARPSLSDCRSSGLPVDVAAASTCQACGAAGDLEAHPVVPLDAGGFRHPNNVLALCADCHAAVETHGSE